MNIIVIIQARMNSKRYPGKMLAPFLGRSVLDNIVTRIKQSNLNYPLILSTSKEVTDDPLANYAEFIGLKVYRGSESDVMSRYVLTLKQNKCDAFFRVCGDSPLLPSFLLDNAVKIFQDNELDIVTNVFPRSFPTGMTIELIRTKIFLEKEKIISDLVDREHITRYFYNNSKNLRIHNFKCKKILDPNLKLALDYPQDLKRLESWDRNRTEKYDKLFPID